jgi:hypothetical protein
MLRLLSLGGRSVVLAACKRLDWPQKQSEGGDGIFFLMRRIVTGLCNKAVISLGQFSQNSD